MKNANRNHYGASRLTAIGARSGAGIFSVQNDILEIDNPSLTETDVELILICVDVFDADRN